MATKRGKPLPLTTQECGQDITLVLKFADGLLKRPQDSEGQLTVPKREFIRTLLVQCKRAINPAVRGRLRREMAALPEMIPVPRYWVAELGQMHTATALFTLVRHLVRAAAQPRPATTERVDIPAMFAASLAAFWQLAARLHWTLGEQAALLAVSESTCSRWKRETPDPDVNALDRLQIVLLAYQRLSELAPVDEDELARLFRAPGSAEDPDHPEMSLLTALATPSILEMDARYRRFASLAHAS